MTLFKFPPTHNYSQEEKEKLQELRKNVDDLNLSQDQRQDWFLIKW
jgi:hypothetical protein